MIVCACGLLLFFVRAKRNFPFLISVDPLTDEWTVVAYPKTENVKSVEQYQIIQEKIVSDFVANWFTISKNQFENNARWNKCDSVKCALPEQYNPYNKECALFCVSSDDLFKQFSQKVKPEYAARIDQASETWTVTKQDIVPYYVTPDASGWQVYIEIQSSISGIFNVLAFVDVKRATETHPATLGYYIEDFNSYRINQ